MLPVSLVEFRDLERLPESVSTVHPLEPWQDSLTEKRRRKVALDKFLDGYTKACEEIRETGYIPSSFDVDAMSVAPVDMFATCCGLYSSLAEGAKRGSFVIPEWEL